MPSIRSVGYPILGDIGVDVGLLYSIFLNSRLIYQGRSIDRIIDIAPLLRDYINSESIIIDWPRGIGTSNFSSQLSPFLYRVEGITVDSGYYVYILPDNPVEIHKITNDLVTTDPNNSGNNGSNVVLVANDYNESCISELMQYTPRILSVFVNNKIDPRQIIFFGGYTDDITMTLSVDAGGQNTISHNFFSQFSGSNGQIRFILGNSANLGSQVNFQISSNYASKTLNIPIVPCYAERYVLYAVNRMGGITHLLLRGRPLVSFSRSNFDIETQYDRLSQVGRSIRRIHTAINKRWELNTGYLSESEAFHIDDIVNSPKIVLHDLEENRLYAVNSANNTIERKTRIRNRQRLIEYTLNFTEARTEIRR